MKKSKPVPSARLIIQQGKASPAQKAAWRKLWQKLIADCQREPGHSMAMTKEKGE